MKNNSLPASLQMLIDSKNNSINHDSVFLNKTFSVDLNQFSTSNRNGEDGMSTSCYADRWFETDKGQALFKTHITSQDDFIAWNELVCSLLCQQIDISCAQYAPAFIDENDYGTISYNFLKPNEKLISSKDLFLITRTNYNILHFDFSTMSSVLSSLNQVFDVDKDQVMFQLFKILLFDFITSQADRHGGNICFVSTIDENSIPKLRLSPLFDNEMAFGDYSKENYAKVFGATDKKEIINFMRVSRFTPTKQTHSSISAFGNYTRNECYLESKEIVNLANSNPVYKNYYKMVIKNLDIQKCYDTLASQGLIIPPELFDWYKCAIETKIDFLNYAEKKLAQEQSLSSINQDDLSR